jgi:hypothetical protein
MTNQKTWLKNTAIALGIAFTGTMIAGIPGCDGKVSTGANAVPTVKYRPDVAESTETASNAGAAQTGSTEAPASGGTGTLKGKVVYDGPFSPLAPLFAKGAAPKDPDVCGVEAIPNQTIVVNDGGLANVFIYLEKAPKGAKVPPAEGDVIFDQKHCVFLPHALMMRVKQQVLVKHDDGALHNTHTYPKKANGFNAAIQGNDRSGVGFNYNLAEREPVSVVCDVHPWMQAYHLPLDHPYCAVSKDDGTFEIKDLPAGKHEFKVWHEVGKFVEKALVVTVKPGDNEITIKVAPSKLGK